VAAHVLTETPGLALVDSPKARAVGGVMWLCLYRVARLRRQHGLAQAALAAWAVS